jgi:hypothetical protein
MRDHGIYIPGADEKTEAGPPELFEILTAVKIRLAQHAYGISLRFKHARDYGRAERRVIDVGVTADVYEINVAAGFLPAYR